MSYSPASAARNADCSKAAEMAALSAQSAPASSPRQGHAWGCHVSPGSTRPLVLPARWSHTDPRCPLGGKEQGCWSASFTCPQAGEKEQLGSSPGKTDYPI